MVTDKSLAKTFKLSDYSGSWNARLNSAADAAKAYVANNPTAADRLSPVPWQWATDNIPAVAAKVGSWTGGPSGPMAVVLDDTSLAASGHASTHQIRSNVFYDLPKDIKAGVDNVPMFSDQNADNYVLWGYGRTTAYSATGLHHPEWSLGRTAVNTRVAAAGSGSGRHAEHVKFVDQPEGGAAHFAHAGFYMVQNNACVGQTGPYSTISCITPRGATQASAPSYGLYVDIDCDSGYTGYGNAQISANYRCCWFNSRNWNGTPWRLECDAAVPSNSNHKNYGVYQCVMIGCYAEDGNAAITYMPNIVDKFNLNYFDHIYSAGMGSLARWGQNTNHLNLADNHFGRHWGISGEHSTYHDPATGTGSCPVNDSHDLVEMDAGMGITYANVADIRWNNGVRTNGNPVPFQSSTNQTKTGTGVAGTRDTTLTKAKLYATYLANLVDVWGNVAPPPPPGPPIVTASAAANVTQTGADLSGTVDPNGADTTAHWDYGPTAAYGSQIPTTDASFPSAGGSGSLPETLTGLAVGTNYHYRLRATNAQGTTSTPDQTFQTASSSSDHSDPIPSATAAGTAIALIGGTGVAKDA